VQEEKRKKCLLSVVMGKLGSSFLTKVRVRILLYTTLARGYCIESHVHTCRIGRGLNRVQ
jgi:hypothetical protein